MTVERQVRLIAGIIILASLVLAHLVSDLFLWVTAFVGANLTQSSITGLCPLEKILTKPTNRGKGRK